MEKFGVEDVKKAQADELETVKKAIAAKQAGAGDQEKLASEEISRLRERKEELEEAIKSK